MLRCSVIGCGTYSRKMPPDITLHHLSKMEEKRNAWLEILGVENTRKHIFECSQQFENSCFNRTMNNYNKTTRWSPAITYFIG
ncbi:hypothetical protein NE865_07325 [Phthorimaea operculella]|nr:hypothetical protein NE865_07325 [Phthorimaea operculella]